MLASAKKRSSRIIKSFLACPWVLNLSWLSWPLWLSKLLWLSKPTWFFLDLFGLDQVSNAKNLFQGSIEFHSSKWKLSRLSLVFWNVYVFLWFETLYCVVTFFITVKASNMIQVLTSSIGRAGNVVALTLRAWGLEHGYNNVNEAILLEETLIRLSEEKEGLEAFNCFFN